MKCNDRAITPTNADRVGSSSAYLILCRQVTPEMDHNNNEVAQEDMPGGNLLVPHEEYEEDAGGEAAGGDISL